MGMYENWENRPIECTCEPPSSSRIVKCPIHCNCMKNGQIIPNSKRIDGQCKICGNWPLYNNFDL
jgi:hypothetical protein